MSKPKTDPATRFWPKVDKEGPIPELRPELGACWLWTAKAKIRGYGAFNPNGATVYAHRWAYESEIGPIPEGLTLDHLCRRILCVNPAHLEPVTSGVNVLRGDTISAANKAKTHCSRGHAYTAGNIYWHRVHGKIKGRVCKICQNAQNRARWDREKDRINAGRRKTRAA